MSADINATTLLMSIVNYLYRSNGINENEYIDIFFMIDLVQNSANSGQVQAIDKRSQFLDPKKTDKLVKFIISKNMEHTKLLCIKSHHILCINMEIHRAI